MTRPSCLGVCGQAYPTLNNDGVSTISSFGVSPLEDILVITISRNCLLDDDFENASKYVSKHRTLASWLG